MILKFGDKFGDSEIEKHKFHQHKRPIWIKIIDIKKVLVSNKISVWYFIGFKDAKIIQPLCILLPKMSA